MIDGSGSNLFRADVGVIGEKIVKIGRIPLGAGEREIDITDRVIAPGFIDSHTHDDRMLLSSPQMHAKASQGVTTVITGNCGISLAPLILNEDPPPPLDLIGEKKHYKFNTFADYLSAIEIAKPALNAACLIGHSTLRVRVMKNINRPASVSELSEMKNLYQQALDDGAIGLSSGTFYPPAAAAPNWEIAALNEVGKHLGAIYATHMRDEADNVIESIKESIEISDEGGVSLVISHHKVTGKHNHGRTKQTLPLIKEAMKNRKIGLDVYPYVAASSILIASRASIADRVVISWSKSRPEYAGRDLSDIVNELRISIEETVEFLNPAGAIYFLMQEDDVQRIMAFPQTMIGSDGMPHDKHPHPRLWGTFPRVIGHYARDKGLFSMEEAIRRMTSLPAKTFGITGRGSVERGYYADLVIFDPKTIADAATFDSPTLPALGVEKVFVNGQEIWRNGQPTGNQPGRALRRQQLQNELH